ncbi:hypothetical protein DBV15_09515 [Temnothorax longispinosus]|uniref:Uncharacterized protein n=1 Tax=Temnothorax longispinosus TaxID=300112 RepID=A0A4V3SAI1_9HYME|nr:hypothetical protein DBV15_09515 [Temnothorax longispinosus]
MVRNVCHTLALNESWRSNETSIGSGHSGQGGIGETVDTERPCGIDQPSALLLAFRRCFYGEIMIGEVRKKMLVQEPGRQWRVNEEESIPLATRQQIPSICVVRDGRTRHTSRARREVESPPGGVATVLGSPRVGVGKVTPLVEREGAPKRGGCALPFEHRTLSDRARWFSIVSRLRRARSATSSLVNFMRRSVNFGSQCCKVLKETGESVVGLRLSPRLYSTVNHQVKKGLR